MDQARWMIVFAVFVCMIFTLGLLHRLSRQPRPTGSTSQPSSWSAAPSSAGDRTPTAIPGTPFATRDGQTAITVLPPPDFCYGTTSPEDLEGPFRQVADRIQSRSGDPDRGPN